MFTGRKREGDGKPFPNIRRIQKLKFAPAGSASDPLNQQANHVKSYSNAWQRHVRLSKVIYFETEYENKRAD